MKLRNEVVKRNKSKFSGLAKKMSADKSNASKGGELDWFTYAQMVPEFRDYAFNNKKGSIGIVKTIFGFHVVKIDNQKNVQKVVQLATIAKKIEASEATENEIFEKAETLTYEVSTGKDFDELVKENNYFTRPLVGIKAMEEGITGLANSRRIVRWTFSDDTNLNDVKRFDLDKGYAVVVLTSKKEKGLMSAAAASSKVKPILVKEKKAAIIASKMNGEDLAAVAAELESNISSFENVTMGAPTLSGVGTEPGLVGAMYAAEIDTFVSKIIGEKGVFAIKVTAKEQPVELPSYEGSRNALAKENKTKVSSKLFEALKDLSSIEDNRSAIY